MGSTDLRGLAEWSSALRFDDLPRWIVERAQLTLIHNLSVALMDTGAAEPAARIARNSRADRGEGARLWSDGARVSLDAAIVANAAMMPARTQDDTYIPGQTHLGATSIPALLAVGERDDRSGRELLTAVVAGYEVGARVSGAYARFTTPRGFRATTLFGPIGCAAGVCALGGTDADTTESALALAASFGGGTNETWLAGGADWLFQVGIAALHGTWAAGLARERVRAVASALHGASGLGVAFAGATQPISPALPPAGPWCIDNVMYKPFPVCAINQTPVLALLDMMRRGLPGPKQMARLVVDLHPDQAAYPGVAVSGGLCDIGAALMSAPFCLAVVLSRTTIEVADLGKFADPDLLDIAARIHVVADPELTLGSARLRFEDRAGESYTNLLEPTRDTYTWDKAQTLEQVANRGNSSGRGFGGLVEAVLHLDDLRVCDLVDVMTSTDQHGGEPGWMQ